MKVGDLVRYWKDGTLGIITEFDGENYTVFFTDCIVAYVGYDELEVVNESR